VDRDAWRAAVGFAIQRSASHIKARAEGWRPTLSPFTYSSVSIVQTTTVIDGARPMMLTVNIIGRLLIDHSHC
jgi:hypothetical protein